MSKKNKIDISEKMSNHLFLNGLKKTDINDPNPKSIFLKSFQSVNAFYSKKNLLKELKKEAIKKCQKMMKNV